MAYIDREKTLFFYNGFYNGFSYQHMADQQTTNKPAEPVVEQGVINRRLSDIRVRSANCEDLDAITDSIEWCHCRYPGEAYGDAGRWDPRCRSWYMNANKDKTSVQLSNPYMGINNKVVFQTFSRFVPIGPEKKDGVVAIDIILGWDVYDVITQDMDILDHFFMVDMQGNLIKHSKIASESFTIS